MQTHNSIKVDGSECYKAIDGLIKSKFINYNEVTEAMYINVVKHFFQGEGPNGKWADKVDGEPSYLQKKGKLLKSIHKNTLKTKAQLYTESHYAAIHNFGGDCGKNLKSKMPQREFFWLDDATIETIKIKMEKYILNNWSA